MESYFVVSCGEDGVDIRQYTKDQLEKHLSQDPEETGCTPPVFLSTLPEFDKGYFWDPTKSFTTGERPVFVIKGEIIVPKAVEVVKRYELG